MASTGAAQANIGTTPAFTAGDGTQNASGTDCTAVLDWKCPVVQDGTMQILDPSTNDVAFTAGQWGNIDTWKLGSSASLDPKDDIQGTWSYPFTDTSFSRNYVALAFNRIGGTGNSVVDFELNQNGPGDTYTNSAGGQVFCRAGGDVLIAFNVGSTAQVSTTHPAVYTWTWSGTPCAAGSNGNWNQVSGAPTEGRLNQSTITNYLDTARLGSSFAAGTFGETAADLTGLANLIKPAAACEYFNHMQVTTSSSTSNNASMEDFIDGGQVFAAACQNPLPPPPPGCNAPTVAISSPADNTTDDTSTVTLSGTSTNMDGARVAVYDGNTAVGDPLTNVASGAWTDTLSGVANGAHTYTVVGTTDCGRGTAAVHITVSGASNGGGSGSGGNGGGVGGGSVSGTTTGSAGNGSANGLWLACSNPHALALADVYAWGGKAHLTGFAPQGSAGQRVTITAAWNHRVLGTATVLGDNSFRARVALPPAALRSNVKRGAYLAELGAKASAPLPFARRMYNTRIQIRFVKQKVTSFRYRTVAGKRERVKVTKYISAESVTFVGTVVGPLTTPRQSVVIRGAPTCAGVAHGPIVARAKVNSRGRFSVTFHLPKSLLRYRVVFLRAQSVGLQAASRGKKAKASRPKPMALYGITRGVHVFGAA